MPHYRCYLLDGSGRIVAAEEVARTSAGEALEFARELCAARRSYAFELWQGRERIFKETRTAACA